MNELNLDAYLIQPFVFCNRIFIYFNDLFIHKNKNDYIYIYACIEYGRYINDYLCRLKKNIVDVL